ncbi:Cadmium, cobalt and zinc/H(+)-K(+) antiporter [Cupriavidus laharis]|uniref:Cadmium, cobalt and zinc/H(+)-K(+) antiporter n=1 Tax=Cupriavidus laharis TaxID=151654 RepID=A0ABN7Z1K9_9BURK|nr:CDF family Co(II)/Ni(II) efflux transporter DmeF [Cupriavidus laharis]CAG9178135.1 Cadmium, cobalt and zinc/H(+)-K(+) antiporter [Cupriavidus laharis]
MHTENLSSWTHSHVFDTGNHAAERGTRLVMLITAVTMVVEIAAGWWFNSMALLADGWHMSSHAFAIGLTAFAYAAARRYASDASFAFGTWKIEVLAGFASAVFLLGVAALMALGSVERLFSPQAIHYREAMAVTALGLLVNLGCALILGGAHHGHDHHGHAHDHHDGHHHAHGHGHHHDINLRSAYLHVLADAATSVLAIVALAGGWWLGWSWLDPVMGLVGAALVGRWALGLLRQSGTVLLDREMDHPVVDEVREVLVEFEHAGNDRDATRVTDLHVWRVGKQQFACIVCLVTHDVTLTPLRVREALSVHEELVHVTVEISVCCDDDGQAMPAARHA